jgi:hypothetical protein
MKCQMKLKGIIHRLHNLKSKVYENDSCRDYRFGENSDAEVVIVIEIFGFLLLPSGIIFRSFQRNAL